MNDIKQKVDVKKVDTKEFELPETLFVRDIENRVFQGIVLQCLSRIEGITLIEGNFIDSLLGRSGLEGNVKGISAEQDSKSQSVSIKVEVNICYGFSIPEKAEEIQSKITEDITRMTGLHVSCVHVVFKNVLSAEQAERLTSEAFKDPQKTDVSPEEYTDEF
ncbi:MAG: Asp23/Gls24 family envelope stress response protein [Parachlamydia sp.]|nr:Asp23/Gls24 family envelope stress response protein [Parachlamydia sp.]